MAKAGTTVYLIGGAIVAAAIAAWVYRVRHMDMGLDEDELTTPEEIRDMLIGEVPLDYGFTQEELDAMTIAAPPY